MHRKHFLLQIGLALALIAPAHAQFSSPPYGVEQAPPPSTACAANNYVSALNGSSAPTCSIPPGTTTGANPTATIGASAVNGSAGTFMRSDAAPALPATLPALNGSNLTALAGANIAAGSVPSSALTTPPAQYFTGTWTPTTNLTIVAGTGGVTVAGSYTKITNVAGTPGTLIVWRISITPTGTATSASVLGTTTFTAWPIAPVAPSAAFSSGSASTIGDLYNNGMLDTGSAGTLYTPTWAATGAAITLNGQYFAN